MIRNRSISALIAALMASLLLAAIYQGLKRVREHRIATNPEVARAAGAPIPVSVALVEFGDSEERFGVDCVIEAAVVVTMGTSVSARVNGVPVMVGDNVKAGDTLVEFDTSDLREDLAAAKVEFEAATQRVADIEPHVPNVRELFSKKMIPLTDFLQVIRDIGRARFDKATARRSLLKARQQLDAVRTAAPFDATVTEIFTAPGAVPQPFSKLVTLARTRPARLRCKFSETRLPHFGPAAPIEVTFTAFPENPIMGRIVSLAPSADEDPGIYSATVEIDEDPPRVILGMSATGRISRAHESLKVPSISLIEIPGRGPSVFVMGVNGKVAQRPVTVVGYADGYALIGDGVEAGEMVVVAGHLHLRDGDTAKVAAVPTAGGLSLLRLFFEDGDP